MQLLSLLKKGYIFIILGLLFLSFSGLPFFAFLPACVYWEIRPGLANGAELNLDVGFFIRGSFVEIVVYVYGGDKQAAVHLMDPSGNILQQGRVDNSGVFRFGVAKDGSHNLHLENDFKPFEENDEQILVKVYYYFYRILLLTTGTILIVVGFVLLIYYELRPKLRATTEGTHVSNPAARAKNKSTLEEQAVR